MSAGEVGGWGNFNVLLPYQHVQFPWGLKMREKNVKEEEEEGTYQAVRVTF